jgi:hypothetical protein
MHPDGFLSDGGEVFSNQDESLILCVVFKEAIHFFQRMEGSVTIWAVKNRSTSPQIAGFIEFCSA